MKRLLLPDFYAWSVLNDPLELPVGAAELRENRRQRTELQRQVAESLAESRAADAIAMLGEHGRLRAFDDGREARQALIRSWAVTALSDPTSALILAHDRREVRLLNEMARAELDAVGRLSDRRMVAEGREWAVGDRIRLSAGGAKRHARRCDRARRARGRTRSAHR